MRSMISVLLLATAAVAQPDPLLGGLTANLLGGQGGLVGGLLGGSGGDGLLEGLLGGDGLVGGLVSGLLGPLLGGGGGSLLGGVLGGAGGLLGGGIDGAVGQVGDLVTCVLSQLLGQVGSLLDQILGPILGALGLQGSSNGNPTTPLSFLEKLIIEIRQGRAFVEDVVQAFRDNKIDLDDIETLIARDIFSPMDVYQLLTLAQISVETMKAFIASGAMDAEILAVFVIGSGFSKRQIGLFVSEGLISQEIADEIFALVDGQTGDRR